MGELNLSSYSTAPLYNTKAVVQETGVSAATLRAWERRYGVPMPERTESNYRLYSERDIALIRWLQARVDEGMAISQAVELYEYRQANNRVSPPVRPASPRLPLDPTQAQGQLLAAFKDFDEVGAERVMTELFALYPMEEVLIQFVQPVLVELGEQWHRNEISVQLEHFASAYIQRKVMTLMNSQPFNPEAPLVVVGCAPGELHEIGVLCLALFLRRQGLRVLYLGQNIPLVDMDGTLRALQPAMLAISAHMRENVDALRALALMVQQDISNPPLFVFGGGAFLRHPELISTIPGLYLADNVLDGARLAYERLHKRA